MSLLISVTSSDSQARMLLILPFHLPSVFWWKDESFAVLLSGHHKHRPEKAVLTSLIALIFKIPLSHTKPSITHRWSILVCRHGLCCHWKCKSCFGRNVMSFHRVIVRIVKFFRWRVLKAFIVLLLFSAVLSLWKAWETQQLILGSQQLMVERDCSIFLPTASVCCDTRIYWLLSCGCVLIIS